MNCEKCSRPLMENAKFCIFCGHTVAGDSGSRSNDDNNSIQNYISTLLTYEDNDQSKADNSPTIDNGLISKEIRDAAASLEYSENSPRIIEMEDDNDVITRSEFTPTPLLKPVPHVVDNIAAANPTGSHEALREVYSIPQTEMPQQSVSASPVPPVPPVPSVNPSPVPSIPNSVASPSPVTPPVPTYGAPVTLVASNVSAAQDRGNEARQAELSAPLRTFDYILLEFLSLIPVVNLIFLLIFACSHKTNRNRAAYSRAKLITAAILTTCISVLVTVLVVLANNGYITYIPFPTLVW